MSTLTTIDKQLLEKLFQMSAGYVLDFTDRSFREFFKDDVGVDIYHDKYNYSSGSKANRMRGFWQLADDPLVGRSIEKLIAYIDTQVLLNNLQSKEFPINLIQRGRRLAVRLSGRVPSALDSREDEFIAREFTSVSIDNVGLEPRISAVLKERLEEIRKCLSAKAPLAVIFLCGSTLEGILLGVARKKAREFNQSHSSPKDNATKTKPFCDWKLNDLINVASDLRLVGDDVKKFSHALRDFRNYIHPYEQMSSSFSPDEHTAKICWQVLQAAITQLSQPPKHLSV